MSLWAGRMCGEKACVLFLCPIIFVMKGFPRNHWSKPRRKRSPHLPSPGGPKVPRSPPKVEPRSQGMRLFNEKPQGCFGQTSIDSIGWFLLRRRPFERNFSLEKPTKSGKQTEWSSFDFRRHVTQDTHFAKENLVSVDLWPHFIGPPFFLSIKTLLCGEAASNDLGWNRWRKNKQKQEFHVSDCTTVTIQQCQNNINQLSGHFWDASDLSAPSCNRFTAFKMFVTSTAVTSSCHWQSLLEA